MPEGPGGAISWRPWSKESFEEAKKEGKLVLLDLSASWCHWCHVMDETTYSDPEIVKTVNEQFVPVRVDIDKRPDISERYNRGGFPTTAFLSDRGESVWGGTYIPPADMKRIMSSVLESKRSGDIESALDRERQHFFDLSKALEKKERPDPKFVDSVFEDIFSTYDMEQGGFGMEPKFPHPDVVDMLLLKFKESGDEVLSEAVRSTLDHMTKGLYDAVDGGVFRYSVSRDWRQPHYEKMLETNLGFLRNLARAHVVLGEERYGATARGVAKYLLSTLWDGENGGFFSSQDADEEYYQLSAKERLRAHSPKIITDRFAGLNCMAVSVLVESGVLLLEKEWIDSARAAWNFVAEDLWDPERKLVRHAPGDDHFFFEDQVYFMEALLAITELTPSDNQAEMMELMDALIEGVQMFRLPDGGFGDILPAAEDIGELAEPRRQLTANSRWARLYALSGAASFRPELTATAWELLNSFPPKEVSSNGLFASEYVVAWWTLARVPRTVEIHGAEDADLTQVPLWVEAKRALDPATIVMAARRQAVEIGTMAERTFAVICTTSGCSPEITDPAELSKKIAQASK